MNFVFSDFLKQLDLKPGESRCMAVDDYEVEIHRLDNGDQADYPMVDLYLDVPLSPNAVTFTVAERTPILPSPIEITESDLAPE
jgi:hypothetical protein